MSPLIGEYSPAGGRKGMSPIIGKACDQKRATVPANIWTYPPVSVQREPRKRNIKTTTPHPRTCRRCVPIQRPALLIENSEKNRKG